MKMSRFDIVVFGATGFTGQYVVEEMLRISQNDASLTWAIAGRNANRLETSFDVACVQTGIKLNHKIPIIVCDVKDPGTLNEMAKQAKVILNCVGPYRYYGEQVVKACIEEGTHHLDISGEPQYLESMQLKYHAQAAEKNIYVIGACGFDSIPAEAGVMYAAHKFEGEINQIECYIKINSGSSGGASIHYATWESAVYGFAHRSELSTIRRQLYPTRLAKFDFPQVMRGPIFYSNAVSKWCIPFMGSDRSVVNRSQRFLKDSNDKRPIQFAPYVECDSFFAALGIIFVGIIFGLLASFRIGRWFLLRYPRFFSGGMVSHDGPNRKKIEETSFQMTFVAKGWSKAEKVQTVVPDKVMSFKLSGPEPGYISCSICIVQAALTILKNSSKMPGTGGVYAPAAAFWSTDLLTDLQSHGINLQIVTPSTR